MTLPKPNPTQRGRKSAIKMPFAGPQQIVPINEPPSHFDELHRVMWEDTTTWPTFIPTRANLAELTDALNKHISYCDLTDQIVALYQNGKKPPGWMEAARAAAARPYARILKNLGVGRKETVR
jgi:hypothetical protein